MVIVINILQILIPLIKSISATPFTPFLMIGNKTINITTMIIIRPVRPMKSKSDKMAVWNKIINIERVIKTTIASKI